MTNKFKCPNCKRETAKADNIIMVLCPCGYEMIKEVEEYDGY